VRRWTDERGAAATIMLFPLFAVVTFMFVQSTMWQQDRQVASAAVDRASAAIALYGSDAGAAQAEAAGKMRAAGMRNVTVAVSYDGDRVVVVATGTAPGIIIGTSASVTVRSVAPIEQFQDP
jgi:hypothetical protein